MFAGSRIHNSRGYVHASAVDALHVRSSDRTSASHRRRFFPADKLHRHRQRMARYLDAPGHMATAKQARTVLLDNPLGMLRVPGSAKLQQLRARSRCLHRRRGGGWKVRHISLPLPSIVLQGKFGHRFLKWPRTNLLKF